MEFFSAHILSAGPVVYPLLLCSVLVLALLVERCVYFVFYPSMNLSMGKRNQKLTRNEHGGIATDHNNSPSLAVFKRHRRGIKSGVVLFDQYRSASKSLRDEAMSIWLQEEKVKLNAHVRWLALLGGVAPLLGLLGTVLGIISMFQNVAHVTGPVTPALLASGMWEAMVTTALGLLIAIPALIASQGFSIWADHKIEKMAAFFNSNSLQLEAEPSAVVKQRAVNGDVQDQSALEQHSARAAFNAIARDKRVEGAMA